MKRLSLKSIILSVLVVINCSFAGAEDPEEVKIGVIAPLTGGLATRGADIANLINVLEPKLNAGSKKYRYKFVLDDGRCGEGNLATRAVQKFINVDKIDFIITSCSGETLQAGPIAQRAGVITFAVLSTHQDIKKLGDYVFRTFVDIERGVESFARYIKKRSGKIAILTEENAFTFGIEKLLKKYLGKSVVYSEDFAPDTGNFNTLLSRVKASGAGGVYFNVLSEGTLVNLVNQSAALGITADLYSYNMPEVKSFREATGKNSEDLEFIGSPETKDASNDFKDLLSAYNNTKPEGPSFEFLLRTFYDAAKSIVDGVEAVGPDPEKVKDFLVTYESHGALGKIRYDKNGDIENVNYVLRRVSKGESVYIGELVGANAVS